MIRKRTFPKSARLLKSRDFTFVDAKKIKTRYFVFVIELKGQGRLGISISKKVLKKATDRNRIKRLIREAFRLNREYFEKMNVHVIGKAGLLQSIDDMNRAAVEKEFFLAHKKL